MLLLLLFFFFFVVFFFFVLFCFFFKTYRKPSEQLVTILKHIGNISILTFTFYKNKKMKAVSMHFHNDRSIKISGCLEFLHFVLIILPAHYARAGFCFVIGTKHDRLVTLQKFVDVIKCFQIHIPECIIKYVIIY